MKEFDLICLKNEKPYNKFSLGRGAHGVVLDVFSNSINALFFNAQNQSEYIIIDVKNGDFVADNEVLPNEIKAELQEGIEKIKSKAVAPFSPVPIKLYDKVELITKSDKYTKMGLNKGAVGVVVDNALIENCVEVDFSNLDDTFSVNINDLKVIK